MSYWALVLTRNGEETVTLTLESMLGQTKPPMLTCIVDDGSTDGTPSILEKFSEEYQDKIVVKTLPNRGYDIRRVAINLNEGIKSAEDNGIKSKYMVISADDCVYPTNYAEFILKKMENNPKLVLASGDIASEENPDVTPRGSGRFVRNSFFKKIGGRYPPYYGYEAWIIHRALQLGYEMRNFSEDLRFKHLRRMGDGHEFRDWGLAMKCLGYHPLEVVQRCVRNVLIKKVHHPKALRILWDYFVPVNHRNDQYFHLFEKDLRDFIREKQILEIVKPRR